MTTTKTLMSATLRSEPVNLETTLRSATLEEAHKLFSVVKAALKAKGMTIVYRSQYNEFRVNHKGGKEITAYYTSDLADAYSSGLDMARREGR